MENKIKHTLKQTENSNNHRIQTGAHSLENHLSSRKKRNKYVQSMQPADYSETNNNKISKVYETIKTT